VFTNYQNTSWGGQWMTTANGTLPADKGASGMLVPAVAGDLIISNAGYNVIVLTNVTGIAPTPGFATNFGVIWLPPVDSNTNGLPDWWEQKYFGCVTNIDSLVDSDGDGVPDVKEYICGTDPTNAASKLQMGSVYRKGMWEDIVVYDDSNDVWLTGTYLRVESLIFDWNSFSGRTYRLYSTRDIKTPWSNASPPIIGNGLPMSYTNAITNTIRGFFRLGVHASQ
jgi:hypothetical protein